ncbi:MAG: hypothetical protein AB1505_05085 [Candidatus Latescibacterota bacterium]
MQAQVLDSGALQASLEEVHGEAGRRFRLGPVRVRGSDGWEPVVQGVHAGQFATSLGVADASLCEADSAGRWRLACRQPGWEAEETVELSPGSHALVRRQVYRVLQDGAVALYPGFRLRAAPGLRYTFALRAHEQPLAGLPALRASVDWALPFPFHVWHHRGWVAIYGVDRRVSPGTLDFLPRAADGTVGLRVYYPDTGEPGPGFPWTPGLPQTAWLAGGTEVSLTQVLAAVPLKGDQEPLLEAERLAAALLLAEPPQSAPLEAVADGIAAFYSRCQLWEPDALGPGRGWFANMWVRTQTGPARQRGEMSGYFDLGWGEGIAVEAMLGMVRHWRRTGRMELLAYVDEMSRNIEVFRRGPGGAQPYYDRSDGRRFGDFLMDHCPGSRIWTHSLGHTGSQLLQLWEEAPDYPAARTREAWWRAARSAAAYLAGVQRPDGDIPDILDEHDREANPKPHRITARAVVCGLWSRLARLAREAEYGERALRLARAVAPEIERYEYYNQMLDGLAAPGVEFVDGEAAYYVLEGLVPLLTATGDPQVRASCRRAAAFAISWTYFYDLPHAHRGVARGGQCCRMPDFPLLYPIGPAKAVGPLLDLHHLTGDPLFERMAEEAVAFISRWQLDAPGQPWHGGMLHAQAQYSGRHWGPDLAGQVDSGMATGNSLAALEAWMAHGGRQPPG